MLEVLWLVLLTSLINPSTASNDCALLSSNYFHWLNTDGSLVIPASSQDIVAQNGTGDSCCGPNCNELWQPLEGSPNCLFCASKSALVCEGLDVCTIPTPESLPTTNLSLFKMSNIGFIALPPKSFIGLSIERLIIENSNLTYIAADCFAGTKSVKALYLKNNTLDYLFQAEHLFGRLQNLSTLILENNRLRVLSSLKSALMHSLEYFSLAGNPIYTLDLFFLQSSSLTFLNLKGITFKGKLSDMQESGISSLPDTLNTLDLSQAKISVPAIQKMLSLLWNKNITTLNLSYLQSSTKLLFALKPIKKTLKYLSLEGTDMSDVFPLKDKDKMFLTSGPFASLTELNMKNCNVQSLGDGAVFKAFPYLTILSLSGNQFITIDTALFLNLPNLYYIDLSINYVQGIFNNTNSITTSLNIMDLSFVSFDLDIEQSKVMFDATPNLTMLSLCSAKITFDPVNALQGLNNLAFLDLSDTLPNSPDLISAYNSLFAKLNSSLVELHFARNDFKFSINYPYFFSTLSSLKILDLENNLIRELSQNMFGPSLERLKMSQNLITTWYSNTINPGSQLKSVDLSNNEITYVSDAMLEDFYKLHSLDLNSNPLICNNKVVGMVCANLKNQTNNLTVVDWQQFHCYDVILNNYRLFSQPKDCDEYYEEVSTTQIGYTVTAATTNNVSIVPKAYPSLKTWNRNWTYASIGVMVFATVIGIIIYIKWWNIRCYIHRYFSLRKTRLLRKHGDLLTAPEIQYDVFVSYSDVDRSWVLDHLIPNMEADGDVCLCFHERDFQVGLSILENIIQCMDASHALLLIVSSGFVRSKWCQFEMHLAQYRLIETLRDQLVLVLMEDIPRKARPQTLHHLMMTKTYLVWPQDYEKNDARDLFWKRLKRALKPNHYYMFDL